MRQGLAAAGITGVVLAFAFGAGPARAQPGPDGFDWVTIDSPGNPAYSGPDPYDLVAGRGRVDYSYRIARTEVTTAQYVEFYNAFHARADPVSDLVIQRPTIWGAVRDLNYSGPGARYIVPAGYEMIPVGGLDWRTVARMANWLHNDKSSELSAITHGAYDTGTFGYDALGRFTDQVTRSPGARYWIPSLDEWIKAAHWDPRRVDADGWWQYTTRSDAPPRYGPPPGFPGGSADNESNSGFAIGQFGHWMIPLGSYPHAASPWGLLDVSGATEEWTEGVFWVDDYNYRMLDGAYSGIGGTPSDAIYSLAAQNPRTSFTHFGARLASTIPSPSSSLVLITGVFMARRLHRRTVPSR